MKGETRSFFKGLEFRCPNYLTRRYKVDLTKEILESMLIIEFLKSKGHDLLSVHNLPADELKKLMTEASIYASGKLAEIEARAHFYQEIHSQ